MPLEIVDWIYLVQDEPQWWADVLTEWGILFIDERPSAPKEGRHSIELVKET
jgi:hypothetical protein